MKVQSAEGSKGTAVVENKYKIFEKKKKKLLKVMAQTRTQPLT